MHKVHLASVTMLRNIIEDLVYSMLMMKLASKRSLRLIRYVYKCQHVQRVEVWSKV